MACRDDGESRSDEAQMKEQKRGLYRSIAQRMASSAVSVDPVSSKLGTKDHWNEAYERELGVHSELGEEGEIWFGEDSEEVIVDWVTERFEPSSSPRILDLGTGNGHLLHVLAEAGFATSQMVGIDYSPAAIELAEAIAKRRGVADLTFETVDILSDDLARLGAFDLVLDKGTYDAISLAPALSDGSHPNDRFAAAVAPLLKSDAVFLITSCNFTIEELKTKLGSANSPLAYGSHVKRPTFSFGGQKGSTLATVAFKRP